MQIECAQMIQNTDRWRWDEKYQKEGTEWNGTSVK